MTGYDQFIAIAVIGVALLIFAVRNVRALYRAEPMPPAASEEVKIPADAVGPRYSSSRRWLLFNVVGAMGFAWQLGLVWTLTAVWGLNYLAATLIAVEIVVVHNFFWHVSWTWSDRDIVPREIAWRLARFNLTTGILSIAGNVAVTAALVRLCGIHDLAANVIAIAACSSANFLVSHRVVFAPILCLMTMLASGAAHAADPSPAASAAFDRDARLLESRLDDERAGKAPFLWIDRLADARQRDARARLAQGDIVVERPTAANPASPPPGAMLHHWMATALIAGASLDRVVRLMQGYDRYQDVYWPTVRRSRLVARDGDTFKVALQLFTKKIISVLLNTEQSVSYRSVGSSRMQVRSVSTRIAEVRDPGQADEREAPIGHDSGFLWRFNNYCALDERLEGTYVQCESLSLTRETPFGLGWVIGPFVTSIPRESLEFTLDAMRTAVVGPGNRMNERGGK